MADDWVCLFNRSTSWSSLQRIIEQEIAAQLKTWQQTLDAKGDLSPTQRAVAESLGSWKIRTTTRATLEQAWHNLQAESPSGTAVH
jgi:hypothetical protein